MKIVEIAEFLNGILIGEGETEINNIASLDAAKAGEISFLDKADAGFSTNASCLLVPENFTAETSLSIIKVKNPKLAFAKIAAQILPRKHNFDWHSSAVISEDATVKARFIGAFATIGEHTQIGEDVEIHDGVRIGKNVSIGRSTVIFPNCVIYDNVSIGENCIFHAGAVIGADGFGFVRDGANGYVKFPQVGTVSIGDDVEIGANTCIDRGALGETVIGNGTKIDNLVQIAHNVKIGERVVIASQTGISGSTVIESDCVIGGQVGMGDHATVKTGAIIGSQAGVLPGKIVRSGVWWGTPVQPLDEYKRQNAMVKGLGRLREEVKEIKKKLTEK
ncbi:MAG: UDP-3-O-(3-hydroxymyristoyl)glucosamine N-acyltransferase [Pyrinomonadaceae bacterium]|nr:UDP-3-O-(3-hydroxymyristoyl)glucosamine N-acyltransferase [Pyrinomonadaceae bacterium]